MHVSDRARNAERDVRKRRYAILQDYMAPQIRDHTFGFVSAGILFLFFFFRFLFRCLLAFGALTQVVHFLLSFWFRKVAVLNPKITDEYYFLLEWATLRRKRHMRSKASHPDDGRTRLFYKQSQDILNTAPIDVQVERCDLAVRPGLLFDTSLCQDFCFDDRAFDVFQVNVSI